jgi:uncharacterized OB-fold protein
MTTTLRVAPAPEEAPFWEWCARGELRLQRCAGCAQWRHPPRPRCPWCRSAAVEWAPASGRGTVFSWTVCHPPVLPVFADRVPYNAVVVELEEGPLMVSNLVDVGLDELAVGMPVEVVFRGLGEQLVLPQFRPRGG